MRLALKAIVLLCGSSILFGQQFNDPQILSNHYTNESIYVMDLHDITGDSIPDLFVFSNLYQYMLKGNSIGFDETEIEFAVNEEWGKPIALRFGKLSYSSDVEVVLVFKTGNFMTEAFLVFYRFNHNTNSFNQSAIIENLNPNFTEIIELGDINNDGKLDIVLSSSYNAFQWFENNGNYNFQEHLFEEEGFSPIHGLIVIDSDNNNFQEILVISNYLYRYEYLDNGFMDKEVLTNQIQGADIELIDMDSDGHEDLFCLGSQFWFSGKDSIKWNSPVDIINETSDKTAFSDVDGDGDTDIIFSQFEEIFYLRNINGSFEQELLFTNDANIQHFHISDIDKDGDTDIVYAESFEHIYWLENDNQLPEANYYSSQCYINSFYAHNSSSVYFPQAEVFWVFGDGSYSNEIHANHIYAEPGIYTVKLEISNEYGVSTTEKEINILGFNCQPPQEVLVGEEVYFENESQGITNWTWFFGDGNQSLEQQPFHIYTQPGDYEITVILTNNEIQECTFTKTYQITVIETGTGSNQLSEDISDGFVAVEPNPFSDFCFLEWASKTPDIFTIDLFNFAGEIIFKDIVSGENNYQLENQNYLNGVYFVRVNSPTISIMTKVLIHN